MTIPVWFAARPSFLTRLLMWRNAVRRSGLARLVAVLVGLVVLGPAVPAATGSRAASWLAYGFAERPLIEFVIPGVLLAVFAFRRRRRLAVLRTTSWLEALPVHESLAARTAVAALAILGLLEWWLAALMIAGRAPAGIAGAALLVVAAGGGAGFWVGWALPGSRSGVRSASQHSATRPPRAGWATRASLGPLGYWALGESHWWGRPRVLARWLVPVLLAVPLGSPARVVVGAIGACVISICLVLYLGAVIRVAFAASWWLVPTGVGAGRFAVATSYLALGREAAIGAVGLLGVYVLGEPRWVGRIALACAGWLVWSALTGLLSGWLALKTRHIAAASLHRFLA